MFQSIDYHYYIDQYGSSYLIHDTDFGSEEWPGRYLGSSEWGYLKGAGAIINCYSSKQSNVPFGLYLFHRELANRHNLLGGDIAEAMEWSRLFVPAYKEYHEQVQEYNRRFNNIKSFW